MLKKCARRVSLINSYCYENENGVLKVTSKSYKNRNNWLVFVINEYTKIYEQHQYKTH